MRNLIIALLVALAAAAGWAVWVFTRPEPRFGNGPANTPVSLSPEQVRVLAMDLLQGSLAREMRVFVEEGRFTSELDELTEGGSMVADDGVGPQGVAAVEVCEEGSIVVLATTAADGSVLAVKAQGLEPAEDGNAFFSHYTDDPACDPTRGPRAWPGGYEVSRRGLLKGGEPADIPLS